MDHDWLTRLGGTDFAWCRRCGLLRRQFLVPGTESHEYGYREPDGSRPSQRDWRISEPRCSLAQLQAIASEAVGLLEGDGPESFPRSPLWAMLEKWRAGQITGVKPVKE